MSRKDQITSLDREDHVVNAPVDPEASEAVKQAQRDKVRQKTQDIETAIIGQEVKIDFFVTQVVTGAKKPGDDEGSFVVFGALKRQSGAHAADPKAKPDDVAWHVQFVYPHDRALELKIGDHLATYAAVGNLKLQLLGSYSPHRVDLSVKLQAAAVEPIVLLPAGND